MASTATQKRQLKTAVQKLAGTFNKDLVSVLLCTVDSVDEDEMICVCTPISGKGGSSIPAVKLNAEANDGFLILPTVGSTVLVATSTRNNYYVLKESDIDKIIGIIDSNNDFEFSSSGWVWNNGTFGGLVKINVLLQKLNQLEAFENTVIAAKNLIAAAAVSSPGTPVTNATLAAFLVGITPTPVVPTTLLQIENTKIKH